MSQFYIYIGGVDYSSWVDVKSIQIQESTQANGQTMHCIVKKAADGSLPAVPTGGSEITCYRDTTLEFAGRIGTVEQNQNMTVDTLSYQLDCVDYTADFDNKTIYNQFDIQAAGSMIKTLVGMVGRGFTSNNVADGPVIGGIFMNYDLPSGTVTQIAQGIQYQWYIDYNRDLNFFYILDRPAPLTSINLDTDTATYFDLDLSENWNIVKNVILLTGAKVKSTRQDRITAVADGDQKFWSLGYAPWDLNTISVSVDGADQSILLDNVAGQAGDGQGTNGEVYVCLDNHGVRFPDNYPPKKDAVVEINYNYEIDPVVRMADNDSIALMAARENTATAPSDGIHEMKFEIPDLRVDEINTIYDYGRLLLSRYAYPIYTARFGSWTQGWKPGQSFTMVSTVRNFNKTMYIHRVTKKVVAKNLPAAKFEYQIEASTSPYPN